MVALLTIVMIVVLVRRAAKAAPPAEPAEAAPAAPLQQDGVQSASASAANVVSDDSSKSLKQSFKAAMKLLRQHVSGRNYRYQIPWFAMLGETSSGKTSALSGLGLNMPLGNPDEFSPGIKRLCNWWFFDRGVVLDLSGDLFLREDARTADEGGWRDFVRQLQRFRPQRPIDGIVLTISAADLYGPNRLSDEAIKDKADILNRKLWQLQKVLRIFFPVYVVITKCDLVDGFADFWRGVPLERRQEIFGWSSPYAIDAAYSPSWSDEVFAATGDALLETQLELAAKPQQGVDADQVFLFPGEFKSLHDPLKDFMGHVFQPSAYHEAFFLRGVYFSGDVVGEATDIGDMSPRPQTRPSLLTDLFEKKIFSEGALARPAAQTAFSGNRTVLALKAALVASIIIFSAGLWFSYSALETDLTSLRPTLRQIGEDIARNDQRQKSGVKNEAALNAGMESLTEESARRLLDAMTRIKTNSLTSTFMVSSWFSTINSRIGAFIAQGFDHIIMRAMHDQLNRRAEGLLAKVPSLQAGAQADGRIEDTSSFKNLASFVDQLAVLEENINRYNTLGEDKDIANVFILSEYLFGIRLPQEFLSYPEYYQRAVQNVGQRPFHLAPLSDKATTRVRELTWNFYDNLFHSGALPRHLYELTVQLRKAEASGSSLNEDAKEFARLMDNLTNADTMLKEPQFAWLSSNQFTPGTGFARIMGRIGTLKVIAPTLGVELALAGQGELDRFKQRLAAYKTNLFGPILSAPVSGTPLQLSPQLEALRNALPGWLERPFMGVRPSQRFMLYSDVGEDLRWNPAGVEQAISYYRDYDHFIGSQLDAFPTAFHDRVIALSLARLDSNMASALAKAQDFRAATKTWSLRQEDTLGAEIRDLAKVTPALTRLLTIYQQNGMDESYSDLYETTLLHTLSLLEKVDRRLNAEGLYLPDNLNNWDGEFPVAGTAFMAMDEAEVLHYMDIQRQRLDFLHRTYAEPLLTYLSSEHFRYETMAMKLTNKWQRIVQELGKYYKRRPGSSVVVLEKFIRFDSLTITAANCYEKLAGNAPRTQTGDFFLSRLQQLKSMILKRCEGLATGEVGKRFAALSNMFNDRLANRFPFANSQPGEPVSNASLSDIRDFYHRFDVDGPAIRTLIENTPELGRMRDEALMFIDDMTAVRSFLDPLLARDKAATPVLARDQAAAQLNVDVAFRVNRAQEIDANQIIGWSVVLGDQTIDRNSKEKKGVWTVGDEVRVVLRWAKDSPTRPIPDQNGGGMLIGDKTMEHVYTGDWGLVRLLKEQLADQKLPAHTLGFETDTQTVVATKSDAESLPNLRGKSRAYIRLDLSTNPADGAAPKAYVLPNFPASAPDLVGRN